MYKYLLFDLDGTISDSGPGITKSVQYGLEKIGIIESDLEKLKAFIGPPLRDSFKNFYNLSDEKTEEAVKYYRERYAPIGIFENNLYEGIPELLKKLHEDGFVLCLASSKPKVFVERILKHFDIFDYFNVVMGSNLDGSLENKEDIIAECLKEFSNAEGFKLSDCLMIGDRKFDIEAAHKCGIKCAGVSYGFGSLEELKEYKADYICESVDELGKLIANV